MPDIKDLIDLAVNDQGVQFADLANSLLYAKASDMLTGVKTELAKDMFNKPVNEANKGKAPAPVHKMGIHLCSTDKKRNGKPLYKVSEIGKEVKRVKVGEHLTDTQLDDLGEAGHKIKVKD